MYAKLLVLSCLVLTLSTIACNDDSAGPDFREDVWCEEIGGLCPLPEVNVDVDVNVPPTEGEGEGVEGEGEGEGEGQEGEGEGQPTEGEGEGEGQEGEGEGEGDGCVCLDRDGDGFTAGPGCNPNRPADCDDTDANVHPGASEQCNNKDDNCDGVVDTQLRNCQTACGTGGQICSEGIWGQCNAPQSHNEVCDDVDNDCDGQTDEDGVCDSDGDGTDDDQDCAPLDPAVHPGAAEICGNNVDDDCDGTVDEGCPVRAITAQWAWLRQQGSNFTPTGVHVYGCPENTTLQVEVLNPNVVRVSFIGNPVNCRVDLFGTYVGIPGTFWAPGCLPPAFPYTSIPGPGHSDTDGDNIADECNPQPEGDAFFGCGLAEPWMTPDLTPNPGGTGADWLMPGC